MQKYKLNTSTINPIASTVRPNLLRLSTCISWIDDAILYENLDDLYHLVSLAPPASTYLGFSLFSLSEQVRRLSTARRGLFAPCHSTRNMQQLPHLTSSPPSPFPRSGVGSKTGGTGTRRPRLPLRTLPAPSNLSSRPRQPTPRCAVRWAHLTATCPRKTPR